MSKIEWTGESWNPIVGCSLATPGCTNCYAMTMASRLEAMGTPAYQGLTQPTKAGPVWTGKLEFSESALLKPLQRKKPQTYFVNSMGDLFHEDCPDEWIDRVFAVMALCPQHTFQVLTKRSDRMREYFEAKTEINPPLNGNNTYPRARGHVEQWANLIGMNNSRDLPWRPRHESGGYWWGFKADMPWPLPNVWLGVSVEDQKRADERIPDLLATPAAVRWISAEPLLGPVTLDKMKPDGMMFTLNALTGRGEHILGMGGQTRKLDWVVVGGESGKDARPMHPDWARSLRDQCAAADVPFFFKQWGEFRPYDTADDCTTNDPTGEYGNPGTRARHVLSCQSDKPGPHNIMIPVGKKCAGRVLDGKLHDEYPRQNEPAQ